MLVGLCLIVGVLRISGHVSDERGIYPIPNSVSSFENSSSSSYEDRLDNAKFRRDLPGQQWQYEGLPIEFPLKGGELSLNETFTEAMTKTTTSASTSKIYPPLNRRSRRIFNPDESSSIDDYPFMAAVLINKELWCGAVIVSRDKVLTAAHCLQLQYNNRIYREYMKMLAVRVGSSNATFGGDVYRVSEIIFHPNYKPETLEFNFALLKLYKNLTFGNELVRSEAIAYSTDRVVPVDYKIQFLGWGAVLGPAEVGGQVLLQKVELPVYDLADCQDVYGRELVTRNNFCAGYITIAKNVCNHDAGGPAIMDGLLIGILSFSSKRCDQADQPAVFSTVGAVSDWLASFGEDNRKIQLRY